MLKIFKNRQKFSKIIKNFQKSQNQRYARTYENQGTPSPSLALECKCAFGAKNKLYEIKNKNI